MFIDYSLFTLHNNNLINPLPSTSAREKLYKTREKNYTIQNVGQCVKIFQKLSANPSQKRKPQSNKSRFYTREIIALTTRPFYLGLLQIFTGRKNRIIRFFPRGMEKMGDRLNDQPDEVNKVEIFTQQ